ncbi:MAG: crosslink repair DNA glycosylase YcaQ family protein [Acidimicrobiia bacterium]
MGEARRLALAAQGFGSARPAGKPGLADIRRVAARVHAFQIDPINVLVRTQYMPAYSRLGPYSIGALDKLAYDRHELFEYYGHAASLLPTALYPMFRWRMDAHAARFSGHGRNVAPPFIAAVLAQVEARGPIAVSDLVDRGRRGNYAGGWSWNDGKRVMTWLQLSGRVAVAGRRNIEQLYDLTERVIPRAVLEAPVPDPEDAKRELIVLAVRALGVATMKDLAGYFGIGAHLDRRADPKITRVPALLADLVEDGRLVPVTVDGWRVPAFLEPAARVPAKIDARALLSPFDSMIWDRDRVKRLFGFDYRIEIYIPEAKRIHGYYVVPFLLGDTLVARVDLKADRKNGALLVQSAFAEPRVEKKHVARELWQELRAMAAWLDLDRVQVRNAGDLARVLRAAM